MATYEKIYELKGLDGKAKRVSFLTLFEASKELLSQYKESPSNISDYTHISSYGRCVAFFCLWEKKVKPMFDACKYEKKLLEQWSWSFSE